jgi:hypothetical protein
MRIQKTKLSSSERQLHSKTAGVRAADVLRQKAGRPINPGLNYK